MAACSLWVRGRHVYDHLTWGTAGGRFVSIYSAHGGLIVTVLPSDRDAPLSWGRDHQRVWAIQFPTAVQFGGPQMRSRDLYVG